MPIPLSALPPLDTDERPRYRRHLVLGFDRRSREVDPSTRRH